MSRAALAACLGLLAACNPSPVSPPAGGPAQRIVSLAPHLTELVYSAGAGDRLVGVVAYSDYPPTALQLPVIGDAFRVDLERLAVLKPDLVLAWESGNPGELIEQIRQQGYRIVVLETGELADVASHVELIGVLAATEAVARPVASAFRRRLDRLMRQYSDVEPVSVFYQVSARPLYTVGAGHPISEIIRICGGHNIFADIDEVAPVVTVEEVLLREPQVILAGVPPETAGVFDHWSRWTTVPAVRNGHLYSIEASLVARSSTRIVDGLREVCAHLDRARTTPKQARSN